MIHSETVYGPERPSSAELWHECDEPSEDDSASPSVREDTMRAINQVADAIRQFLAHNGKDS